MRTHDSQLTKEDEAIETSHNLMRDIHIITFSWHCAKCNTGINLALYYINSTSTSTKSSPVPNNCFFLPFCIIFANISTPSSSKLVPQTFLHSSTTRMLQKIGKTMQIRAKRSKNVWHWATFSWC